MTTTIRVVAGPLNRGLERRPLKERGLLTGTTEPLRSYDYHYDIGEQVRALATP